VDGVWDGTAQFDGGTPARSVQVPVRPNAETAVAVTFALRGGLGRLWIPVDGAIRGFTENELLVDHASQNGLSVGGARATAFDADGNLWATFSDGVRMYTPDSLANGRDASRDRVPPNATGIAIRGDTIAVASCSGPTRRVSRSPAATSNATPRAQHLVAASGASASTPATPASSGGPPRSGATRSTASRPTVGPPSGVPTRRRRLRSRGGRSRRNAWASSCSGRLSAADQLRRSRIASSRSRTSPARAAGLRQAGRPLGVSRRATGPSGNLVLVTVGTGTVQLNSLTQVTFGGIAFDPARPGCPRTSRRPQGSGHRPPSAVVRATGCLPSGAARRTSSAPCPTDSQANARR
jgi:hypothetical protein